MRFTFPGSTSRTCSSTTGSRAFVKTKNRVAIFFPGLISEAKCEYRAGEIATLLALLGELNEGEFCEFFFRLGVRKGEKPHRA